MNVWQKQTIRYLLHGKQASKGTTGAVPSKELSRRFYGSLRADDGKRKQVPLTDERRTSLTLLRRLQTEHDERRANGVDKFHDARLRPLLEHLDEYESFLQSKGNTVLHVQTQTSRCRKLITTTKAKTSDDLDGSRILKTLAIWRTRKAKPLSVQSSNHYLVALKGFTRWLWTERRTSDDALVGLRKMNAEVDRRRIRRALTTEELKRLLLITNQGRTCKGKDWRLTGTDRSVIYLTAAMTGLRCRELSTLRRSSFDFDSNTMTLEASNTKNRKRETLPIAPSLASKLKEYLNQKPSTNSDIIWGGSWAISRRAGKILKRDLKASNVPVVDASGKVVDFHSLRYTFITSLARAGVHPAKAQRLARHSSVNLTMNVYTSLNVDDLRGAVDALPTL